MPQDFGVFIQDDKGPLSRGFFDDAEAARRECALLAATERVESFVYSFQTFREVARYRPPRHRPTRNRSATEEDATP
jgi:hypothetical protein